MHQFLKGLTLAVLVALVRQGPAVAQSTSDSLKVVAAITAFHQALAQGDSVAALALLAPDATILEAGAIESRRDYRAHHLPDDLDFARAVPGTNGPISVVVLNDVAWASSTSITVGTFEGRAIDSQSAELVILSRAAGGWQIRAIHWSSHSRRPR